MLQNMAFLVRTTFYGDPAGVFRLLPLWESLPSIALALALLLFNRRLARWVFPMPRPECPECGYALPDGADRCPECGLSLSKSEPSLP
jgi:hypothetical protein